jgi:hypothetical protein
VHALRHAPDPLQVYAPHAALGSLSAAKLPHEPFPLTAHDWHDEHALAPQHTPSTQLPPAHWFAAVHAAASAFWATHAPDAQ